MKKILSICMILLLSLLYIQPVYAGDVLLTRGTLSQKIVDVLEVNIDASDVENPFTDIQPGDEYYDAALWMYQSGYLGKFEDGSFKSDRKLTNAQVAKVITYIAFGNFSVTNFEEISNEYNNHWASIYLWKAVDSGLMVGVGNHNTEAYAVENNVNFELFKTLMKVETNVKFNRGSFCQKIADTLQSRNPIIDASAISNPFDDLDGDEDYYEAILWMTAMGYIMGYEDGTFKPEKSITRAEVARILTTMLYGEDFDIPENPEYDLDYNKNTWYAKYAWKAKSCGLMNSKNNLFYGENVATENDINYNVVKEYADFDEITILIDGEKMSFKNYELPMLKNGVVMAPMRKLCETLDTYLEWDANTKTAIIKKNNKTVTLQIDNKVMYIDGKAATLDEPPCIDGVAEGRLYVPARAIAETFDARAYWYSEINTLIIKNSSIVNEDDTNETVNYRINSVTIKDTSGNELSSIPTETFLATVSFTNVSSSEDTVIILAEYSDAGALKGLMYIQTEDVPTGSTIKLSIPVDNSNGDVAKIKAFCWGSFDSLTPMGNSVSFPVE